METQILNLATEEQYIVVNGVNHLRKPIFSVLLKRTYNIHENEIATRSEIDLPIQKADLYYDQGSPQSVAVMQESDIAPFKLETDVIFISKAYAPEGNEVQELEAGVEVAGKRKILRVIGDRYCKYRPDKSPIFSDPLPFSQMEIRYDKAYGGKDTRSVTDLEFHYPRNPVGKGVVIKNTRETIDGLALPNIEDPQHLLTPDNLFMEEVTRWNQQPLPQGIGWMQRNWYPRCSFVGSVPGFVDPDDVMKEEALGLVPEKQIALARQFKLPSFDVRFNNGASIGLRFPYLKGGELIRLANLRPDKKIFAFHLPIDQPRLMLDIGLGEKELEAVLHTVLVRVEDMQVDLLWRGAHEYPSISWAATQMKRMATKII